MEHCKAESNNLHACACDNQREREQLRGDTPHRIDFQLPSCRAQMEGCWEMKKGWWWRKQSGLTDLREV